MKNIILLILLLFCSFISGYAQTSCDPPENLNASVDLQDVTLSWNTPITNGFFVISENVREIISPNTDSSPSVRQISDISLNRDFLDIQFVFPVALGDGEAGVESDGLFIFSAKWNGDDFYQYNLDGTYIGSFKINGINGIRDLAYASSTGYFYGGTLLTDMYVMDFYSQIIINTINTPVEIRAIAYNDDHDSFYANNWSTDIVEFDRTTGANLGSFPVGTYSSYYGFAYDNWSDGGPYLWGFSQDGSGSELVQIQLPGGVETGLVVDVKLLLGFSEVAGGLFTQYGIIPGKVSLGGLIQNEVIFGLELSDIPSPPPVYILAEYNIYRDGNLLTSVPYTDSTYVDSGLNTGTYQYEVTAVYNDTLGSFLCESTPAGPVDATILEQYLLGGNVFAGVQKLDDGKAFGYKIEGENISHQSTVDIDDFGYYFFFPFEATTYCIATSPTINSAFYNNYIPTYYGDVYHWENAQSLLLQNNMYNADIQLIELSAFTIGSGRINGTIYTDNKSDSPASGILMLLLNSSNECIAKTYSNTLGYFGFDQLGDGTYKLLCEIVGKKMTPQTIVLNSSSPYMDNMSFFIQQDEVVMGLDDQPPDNIEYISEVFPNPVQDFAHITIKFLKPTSVNFSVIDLTGRIIYNSKQSLPAGLNQLSVNTEYFSKGVYSIYLRFDDGSGLSKKFIRN